MECTGSTDSDRMKSAFCPPVTQKLESVRRRLLSLPKSHVEWRLEYGRHNRRTSFEGTWRARNPKSQGSVAQALLCAGARSQGGVSGIFKAQLAVWATSWSLQDVHYEISGKSTAIMERVRKETIQPESVVQSLVSAGSICNIEECPVTLLRFPDDEDDFRDSSFPVSYWLVLEIFEPETGIGSSMPV
jgi:hypothetical protein